MGNKSINFRFGVKKNGNQFSNHAFTSVTFKKSSLNPSDGSLYSEIDPTYKGQINLALPKENFIKLVKKLIPGFDPKKHHIAFSSGYAAEPEQLIDDEGNDISNVAGFVFGDFNKKNKIGSEDFASLADNSVRNIHSHSLNGLNNILISVPFSEFLTVDGSYRLSILDGFETNAVRIYIAPINNASNAPNIFDAEGDPVTYAPDWQKFTFNFTLDYKKANGKHFAIVNVKRDNPALKLTSNSLTSSEKLDKTKNIQLSDKDISVKKEQQIKIDDLSQSTFMCFGDGKTKIYAYLTKSTNGVYDKKIRFIVDTKEKVTTLNVASYGLRAKDFRTTERIVSSDFNEFKAILAKSGSKKEITISQLALTKREDGLYHTELPLANYVDLNRNPFFGLSAYTSDNKAVEKSKFPKSKLAQISWITHTYFPTVDILKKARPQKTFYSFNDKKGNIIGTITGDNLDFSLYVNKNSQTGKVITLYVATHSNQSSGSYSSNIRPFARFDDDGNRQKGAYKVLSFNGKETSLLRTKVTLSKQGAGLYKGSLNLKSAIVDNDYILSISATTNEKNYPKFQRLKTNWISYKSKQ